MTQTALRAAEMVASGKDYTVEDWMQIVADLLAELNTPSHISAAHARTTTAPRIDRQGQPLPSSS